MHIGSVMTENVPEADPEYTEVAKEYEKDVLVVGVPDVFSNRTFQCPVPTQGKPGTQLLLFSNYYVCLLIEF
jgi:hypothetical protein